MMKKILSGLMILVLLILFVTTYLNSKRTEDIFRAQIKQLNQSQYGLLRAELLQYRRGLLVSEAQTRIYFRSEPLTLQHRIRHFPWKMRLLTGPVEAPSSTERQKTNLSAGQLQLTTDINLDGTSRSRFTLPDLEYGGDSYRLRIEGLTFRSDLDTRFTGGKLDLQLGNLTFSEPGKGELQLKNLRLSGHWLEQQQLPIGSSEMKIDSLSLTSSAERSFEFIQLRYAIDTVLQDNQLASRFALQLASLEAVGEKFEDVVIDAQMGGLATETVQELQQTVRQMRSEQSTEQIDPLIFQLQLLGLYSQLLADGLSISLDRLAVRADRGQLEGKGQLQLLAGQSVGPGLLTLDTLNGGLQFEIDKEVFNAGFRLYDNLQRPGRNSNRALQNELAEQLAGGLIQKGILVRRQGGGYSFEFTVNEGHGRLNGVPFQF